MPRPAFRLLVPRTLASRGVRAAASGLAVVSLIAAAFLALAPGLLFPGPGTYEGDADAPFYWARLLAGHAVRVAETDTHTTFAWVGVDTCRYYRIARADAEAGLTDGVRAYIDELIEWMESDTAKWGHAPPRYAHDLRSITGEPHGEEPAAWRTWWDAHRQTFLPPPDVYERLTTDRTEREAAEQGEPAEPSRHRAAPAAYRAFVWQWWALRLSLVLFTLGATAWLAGTLLQRRHPAATQSAVAT